MKATLARSRLARMGLLLLILGVTLTAPPAQAEGPFRVTFGATPTTAQVGQIITLWGSVTVASPITLPLGIGVGVPNQRVEVFEGGLMVAQALTRADGSFVAYINYWTTGTRILFAVVQRGNSALESQSANVTIVVSSPPPPPTPLTGATAISAGWDHTCSILSDEDVWCWGYNAYGQLGNGGKSDSLTPVRVSGLTGATVVDAGWNSTCAIVSGGEVRCWGANYYGQLGNGTTTDSSLPVAVTGITGAIAIGAGSVHTCAIVSGGEVRCWGANYYGQLGNGTTTDSLTPVAVTGITDATSIAIPFGGHTCAIVAGGEVRCWGNNGGDEGKLGNGTTTDSPTPVAVTGITDATAIAAGRNHTCATVSGGEVRCWGYNGSGQLGDGTHTNRSTPVAVSGLSGTTVIGTGVYHSSVIVSGGGEGRCWGGNVYGQLGNGTTTGSSTPVSVTGLTGASAIAAGAYHNCAIVSGGEVRCWGQNSAGQLGDGTTTDSSTPVVVVQQ